MTSQTVSQQNITQEFFAHLGDRKYEPLLHSITGIIAWEIEKEGKWFVTIQSGHVTVSQQPVHADCVLSCPKAIFEGMVQGKLNPITSLMQEKVIVNGEIGLAQVFQRLFRV